MHSFTWYIALVLLFGVVIFAAVPSEGADDKYFATVGAATFPGDIGEKIWLDYGNEVKRRSNGAIRLRMLIYAETGGEESRMPAMLRGRVHISSFSDSGMSLVVPEFGILTAPFLFDSVDEAHFIVDNFLKEPYSALAHDKGIVVLNWQDVGWLNIYGSKPLLSLADTTGFRMRSLQSDASILFLQAIGADVIHIQRTELVPSLQTGLVEGGESSLVLYATGGEAQYAAHMTLTQHARQFGFSVANGRWFKQLTKRQKEILTTSFGPESNQRQMALELLQEEKQNLMAMGGTLHVLTKTQRDLFRARTIQNRQILVDSIGGQAAEIMGQIKAGQLAFARQGIKTTP